MTLKGAAIVIYNQLLPHIISNMHAHVAAA